jgi:hypothetical protein
MKLWVLISLLLSLNTFAQGEAFTDKSAYTDKGISENIRNLSTQICGWYSSDSTKVAENVKRSVFNHMKKYENIPAATPTQMIHFLNRNKHHMTCGDDNAGYMVESFRHGAYDQLFNVFLFDYLLVDDESLYVDVNAISYTGGPERNRVYGFKGEPELTLDYMDRETKNPAKSDRTRKEIKRLINMFEDYLGGKRYSELSAQEKQAGFDAYNDLKTR